MSEKTLERSNLIDVTFGQIHSILSGHHDGTTIQQLEEYLSQRVGQLKQISEPFGRPSDASKKKVSSGSVTLADGVSLTVDDADKEFIFAISAAFQVDEIQALILFRSFLYNQGLQSNTSSDPNTSIVQELVEAITPFYCVERLSTLRVLIPLLRARESTSDPFNSLAVSFLPKIIPDGKKFAESLISEYTRKTQEDISDKSENHRAAVRRAKQSSKEQLVILEVLFWIMWGSVACDGTTVESIFVAAYDTNLGSEQRNSNLLLDDEAQQLQQDIAVLWVLIAVEVLELETIAEPGFPQISDTPTRKNLYTASPSTLKRIHELVTSHRSSQFSCIYLAWTYVVSRCSIAAESLGEIPQSYMPFFELTLHRLNSYSNDREPAHISMPKTCLDPEMGLLRQLLNFLTSSPWFVTAAAWRTSSHVTDPNAIAFRSVLKGLVMSLVELVPVEHIADFDGLVDVWVALFGESESQSVTAICKQFWLSDWHQGIARRAILEVARSRFPVQVRPLIRLLRSMTSAGSLESDAHSIPDPDLSEDRDVCLRHVFYFFDRLPSYTQVVRLGECTGAHARYERQQERYGSSTVSGLSYSTLREIGLPGGAVLPPGTTGRLLSGDAGDSIVVAWSKEHSGWKLILDILRHYTGGKPSSSRFQSNTLSLDDIGLASDGGVDESLVTDILDLIRSLIHDSPVQAEQLMQTLETVLDADPQRIPDLVQLTTTILDEALSRSSRKQLPPTQLITSAISVLTAILAIPRYSNRVWIYIRSTAALFGSAWAPGFTSIALAAERATGHYTMTLTLLQLVHHLFQEASLLVVPDDAQLRKLKNEVLLRAIRFVHTEIWSEHLGWKYANLGDRFEIGRRVTSLYIEVLHNTPHDIDAGPFKALSQTVLELLLFNATTSTLSPLVSSITTGGHLLSMLYASRRVGDVRKLIFLLESSLQLSRLLLTWKRASSIASKSCLLEQMMCARTSNDQVRVGGIDALAAYTSGRNAGTNLPLIAVNVLYELCSSLSSSDPPSTIIGHFSDPEAVVSALVSITENPYGELSLRYAVWSFISLAMDKEPALATLFVAGQFHHDVKGKGKASDKSKSSTAFKVAQDGLSNWQILWELNPQLLASISRFLHTCWRHALEHRTILEDIRGDTEFWENITALACSELGPLPDYDSQDSVYAEGARHSLFHETVAGHAYRTTAKSCALRIIGLDLGIHARSATKSSSKSKSLLSIESKFKSEEDLTELLMEAAPNSYRPETYDELQNFLTLKFPGMSVAHFKPHEPLDERNFGDDFAFSGLFLQRRIRAHHSVETTAGDGDTAEKLMFTLNLNLSLMHSQLALAESWQFILQQLVPYLRGDVVVRVTLMNIAAALSFDISRETRQGDMAATIHDTRLSLLLSILEVVWFSSSDKPQELQAFLELTDNVRAIVLNNYQSPAASLLGSLPVPFHPPLLQILYFCSKYAKSLMSRPKVLQSEQRLKISLLIDGSINLAVEGLRIVFGSARTRMDENLDRDMELLVAVFEQCTRPDVNPSSAQWLSRCQEADIIKSSLDLYAHIDLVGLSDPTVFSSRKSPLYASHLLLFHICLASIPAAAERLANDGVLAAYSSNFVSEAISSGKVDVSLPELPGLRSPAHYAYCSMLSVISGVVSSMGRHNHYFDSEACGVVQLYGEQITRALAWNVGDAMTLPFLEELEQVVHLFYVIAENAPSPPASNAAVAHLLNVFSPRALEFLQHLNYAITHPNHLAAMFEAVTSEERALLEEEMSIKDPLKRPLVVHIVHRLYRLSCDVISTLISISRAETVLTGERDSWPTNEAHIVPHSKVVLGEPASLGTLLEMGNSTIDLLRELVNLPAAQKIASGSLLDSKYGRVLDVREGVSTGRRNLEAILIYSMTQLAMWLSKPEFEGEMEAEPPEHSRMDVSTDRRPRTSTMTERLRRGMTGDLASDLQSLLNRAKPVVSKTSTFVEKDVLDLTDALSFFLQDKIISRTHGQ